MSLEKIQILGISISVLDMEKAVNLIATWAEEGLNKTIFFRDVHSLMLAFDNQELRKINNSADIIAPDGMPLVWISRSRGFDVSRVCGPDLLPNLCERTSNTSKSHFFYGGRPGVAIELARNLKNQFPSLKIAGTLCPPMRDIDTDFKVDSEIMKELEIIQNSGATYIWVGISSPKQEIYISKISSLFQDKIFLAVGAAFDFHSGEIKRAPRWMQKNGLEWLFRLINDPFRLWKRYFIIVPRFLFLMLTFKKTKLES